MTGKTQKFDYLWLVLFLIIFINGFEAGGYQASLRNIGQNYDLSVTSMGLFASTELFATMLAPLILGRRADRNVNLRQPGKGNPCSQHRSFTQRDTKYC